jgi:hypothetical protein
MRNNKALLDEAARSVRRTFIGSVAGTAAMLAVVGAAGAYGMPDKLTARALIAAISTLKFSPVIDRAFMAAADTAGHAASEEASISAPVPPLQRAAVQTVEAALVVVTARAESAAKPPVQTIALAALSAPRLRRPPLQRPISHRR